MVAASSRRRNRHNALSLFPRRGMVASRKIGRATTRRAAGRITRAVGGRRAEKRRVAAKAFDSLLQMAVDSRTSATHRMALATGLVSMAIRYEKYGRWMHKCGMRVLACVVTILKAAILAEQVPEIRSMLLRLLSTVPLFHAFDTYLFNPSYTTMRPDAKIHFLLAILEQELTKDEQAGAIYLLDYCLRCGIGDDAALGDRVVQACVRLLDQHHEARRLSDSDVRRVVYIMDQHLGHNCTSVSVDHILASEHVISLFFAALRNTHIVQPLVYKGLPRWDKPEVASKQYSLVLADMFNKTTVTSRATLIDRHLAHIQEALPLLYLDHINRFAQHTEFAEIIVRTPCVLGKMTTELYTVGKRLSESCFTVTNLFEALRGNDGAIQTILGHGLIRAARAMAQSRHYADAGEIGTWQRVLTAHPEWKRRFKAIVSDGDALSQLRQMGDAIPDRVRRPVQYVMEEDAEEL